jgi:hypothetical protein
MEDGGTFYGHLVYFVALWYIFPRVGKLYQEKSGSPGWKLETKEKNAAKNWTEPDSHDILKRKFFFSQPVSNGGTVCAGRRRKFTDFC